MTKYKLKPCPFCGGKAQMVLTLLPRKVHTVDRFGYYVYCPSCSANFSFMPGMLVRTYDTEKPEDAAAWWNRRSKQGGAS